MHKDTFAEIERLAHEKAEQRQALLDAEAWQSQAEGERQEQEYLDATIDFFITQGLDRDVATSAIRVSQSNNRWGYYYRAHFAVKDHLPIMVDMIRDEHGKFNYGGDSPWIVDNSGQQEYAPTLGDALITSTRLQAENATWIAEDEAQEAIEMIEIENQNQIIEAAMQAKLDAVRTLLDRHPDAWRMIVMVALSYEVSL